MNKKLYFCVTCVDEGKGRAMSEAESLVHKDNFLDHTVVAAEEEIPNEN